MQSYHGYEIPPDLHGWRPLELNELVEAGDKLLCFYEATSDFSIYSKPENRDVFSSASRFVGRRGGYYHEQGGHHYYYPYRKGKAGPRILKGNPIFSKQLTLP